MTNNLVLILGILFALSGEASSMRPTSLELSGFADIDGYAFLNLHSEIDCSASVSTSAPNFITAHVVKAPREWIRTHLIDGSHTQVLTIGKVTQGQELSLELRIAEWENRLCKLKSINWELTFETDELKKTKDVDWEQVARQWSPRIVVRNNNYNQMKTDVLLDLRHIIEEKNDRTIISYTAYYSDEDSKTSKQATNSQNGSWGRTLDVEKVLELSFTREGELLDSQHQAELHFFKDSKITNSKQPLLFNVAQNNIFSNSAKPGFLFEAPLLGAFSEQLLGRQREASYPRRVSYNIASTTGPKFPDSRDRILFEELEDLWMLKTSDNELMREGKLAQKASALLYVFVKGELLAGKLSIQAKPIGSNLVFSSGGSDSKFNRLGHHMWGKESLSAVVISEEISQKLAASQTEINIEVTATKPSKFNLEDIQAFVVREDPESGRYKGYDVTEQLIINE
ncbi:hypothetical protein GW915_03850 [bacterium]|nr:hypothetical protein [bacterium]